MLQHPFPQPLWVQIQFLGHDPKRNHGIFPIQPRPCVTAGRSLLFGGQHLACQDIGGAEKHHSADASPATNQFIPRQGLQFFLYHLTQDFPVLLTNLLGCAHLPTP